MFGLFKKKSEVQLLVDRVGEEQACLHYAQVVLRKIPNGEIFRQFLLEELDAASKGNEVARQFARDSGFAPADYTGALRRSHPEVDGPGGPQQELLRISLQLRENPELMVRFRLSVVEALVRNFNGDVPSKAKREAAVTVRTTDDLARLVRQQGAEEAGKTIRELAHQGNLVCQLFLSNSLLRLLQERPTEEVKRDCKLFTRLAAEQGDAGSQFNLAKLFMSAVDISDGFLHEDGQELIENAKLWHRKAAAQGFAPSVKRLKELEKAFP